MPEKVSVIIPVYNSEKYLRDTLNSVAEQTMTDFCVYCIDDSSTDATKDIVAEYQKKLPGKVVYHLLPARAGKPSVGKNVGIQISKGEVLAFLDHDDLWDPAKLEKQLKDLSGRASISISNAAVFRSQTGEVIGNYWNNFDQLRGNFLEKMMERNLVLTSSSVVVRREAIRREKLFNESLTVNDDYEAWLWLLSQNPFELQGESLTKWRLHKESLSSQKAKLKSEEEGQLKELLTVYETARSYMPSPFKERAGQRSTAILVRLANALLARGAYEEAAELYGKCSEDRRARQIGRILPYFPWLARLIVIIKRNLGQRGLQGQPDVLDYRLER